MYIVSLLVRRTAQEDTMNATPSEIDTQLAEIYAPLSGARHAIHHAEDLLDRSYIRRDPKRVAGLEKTITDAKAAIAALDAKAEPLEAIYRANPWTRFFLVPGGHLHSSRLCSTLRWNTALYWLPEYSGQSEAEIVALAGEKACTVCYPSAPVDRPSMLPVHVAERAAQAKERAEKKAARAAAAANVITVGATTYKTQRAAENQISYELDNMVSRRYMEAQNAEHRTYLDGLAAEDEAEALTIAAALAQQVPGYDAAAVLNKKFTAKVKQYRKDGWAIPEDATL
jgi:hypothetical protein